MTLLDDENRVGEDGNQDEDEEEDDDDDDDDAEGQESGASNQSINEKEEELREPFFDGEFYRCLDCGFEVFQGRCESCGLMLIYSESEHGVVDSSLTTDDNFAIHPDRSLIPRGTTPLLEYFPSEEDEFPPSEYLPSYTPLRRPSRIDEYHQLRRRGATRLMCETFGLSFTYEDGIYAWADAQLFEDFSGPKMKEGDTWKIHLGRRIHLDDDDLDGSGFIEALLEETVYFPAAIDVSFGEREFRDWDTTEETDGIWVTKIRPRLESDNEEATTTSSIHKDGDSPKHASSHDGLFKHGSQEHDGALRSNVYETDVDEVEEVNQEIMALYPGFTRYDLNWAGAQEKEDEGDDEAAGSSSRTMDDENEQMDISASDSFDSDFDSDEDLSGDDMVAVPWYSK
ncbi:hypothetical protein CPB83DRAFT_497684 [Crepidotus variabilis]|uniref:DUF8191 domain-containing protein n=1 Tax=Crepidotus variabilis TaxID=179855 RepID=A0A9P6EBZ9_9AGAR|nr:hypothetical protein CPB83DRAFT_497684 [Crepidotus variabilis]